jgi:hypothetical protein
MASPMMKGLTKRALQVTCKKWQKFEKLFIHTVAPGASFTRPFVENP